MHALIEIDFTLLSPYDECRNLTEYTEVVYLDADTIVLRNLDELFLCDGFCGVMRHSERLNTGVMVLQPSADLLDDMLKLSPDTPSYTGGDQGFLNKYFSNFPKSVLFEPAKGNRLSDIAPLPSEEGRDDEKGVPRPRIGRLVSLMNIIVFRYDQYTSNAILTGCLVVTFHCSIL